MGPEGKAAVMGTPDGFLRVGAAAAALAGVTGVLVKDPACQGMPAAPDADARAGFQVRGAVGWDSQRQARVIPTQLEFEGERDGQGEVGGVVVGQVRCPPVAAAVLDVLAAAVPVTGDGRVRGLVQAFSVRGEAGVVPREGVLPAGTGRRAGRDCGGPGPRRSASACPGRPWCRGGCPARRVG